VKLTDYIKSLSEGENIDLKSNLGYVITPNIIRRCFRLSQEEKMILFEIYSHYNESTKSAYPTQQHLALCLGTSASMISKNLRSLDKKGFVKILGKKKKKYVPLFNLHDNPYIVLTDWFVFIVKTITKYDLDIIGGDWADKMLQIVNVTQKKEYTEDDLYGEYLRKLQEGLSIKEALRKEFIIAISIRVEDMAGMKLEIDWEAEIRKQKQKEVRSTEKSSTRFQKREYKSKLIPQESTEEGERIYQELRERRRKQLLGV
jgi:hypothetical protein